MLLDELHRAGMKNILRRDVSRGNALSMAIAQKSIEHMPVRFQPISPGIGVKNPLLFGQIMIGPRFDQAGNCPPPALRPSLCVGVKPK